MEKEEKAEKGKKYTPCPVEDTVYKVLYGVFYNNYNLLATDMSRRYAIYIANELKGKFNITLKD
jgi:hypothetical protein